MRFPHEAAPVPHEGRPVLEFPSTPPSRYPCIFDAAFWSTGSGTASTGLMGCGDSPSSIANLCFSSAKIRSTVRLALIAIFAFSSANMDVTCTNIISIHRNPLRNSSCKDFTIAFVAACLICISTSPIFKFVTSVERVARASSPFRQHSCLLVAFEKLA
ncbi:unnamed protein product [Linum trigynum]|uniref:Uncharacterized protein n=1 Tax=Linum trigynum TaxID=586398 RepID=A0AAV2DW83_9ROSI